MSEQRYFQVHFTNVPRESEELVSYLLFEAGAGGVQENLQYIQRDRHFSPELIESDEVHLIAYFESPPEGEALQDIVQRVPGSRLHVSEHDVEDWLALWKESWQPFELCRDVWIVPPWRLEEFSAQPGQQAILIEPGMAFGTGTHPTTQIASQLIVDYFAENKPHSVLDVGTGSGILALLAHTLGAQPIYAYDNDPEAQRVVGENCQLNKVKPFLWEPDWDTQLKGQVDLTIANIIDGVLVDLKDSFKAMQSSHYIFTGILQEREAKFLEDMLQGWPLKEVKRLQIGEWVGFLFEANS